MMYFHSFSLLLHNKKMVKKITQKTLGTGDIYEALSLNLPQSKNLKKGISELVKVLIFSC